MAVGSIRDSATEKMSLDDSENRPSEPGPRFLMTPDRHRRRARDQPGLMAATNTPSQHTTRNAFI
jgi:hypothetical protein